MTITSIGIDGILQLLPLAILSILALWKENAVLFMIVAGLAMMTGLYAPDILSGNYLTTNLGISVGLGLIAFSFLSMGWGLKLMLWNEE